MRRGMAYVTSAGGRPQKQSEDHYRVAVDQVRKAQFESKYQLAFLSTLAALYKSF